jgi:hypothetical protein
MVRKMSSSQDIREVVDSMEAVRASASVLQGSLSAFLKARESYDEKSANMSANDLLKEAVEALDHRVPLLVRANAINVKVIKALDTALAAFIDEAGPIDPAAAAEAVAKNTSSAAAPAPAASSRAAAPAAPGTPAAPTESGGRAPKAQPDRLKNFMAGFAAGAEAAAAGKYDHAEEDKKGYTARGYRAGREFFEKTGRSKGELVDLLPALVTNLVEAGKHDEANEMRELLRKEQDLAMRGASTAAAPAPAPASAAAAAPATMAADQGEPAPATSGETVEQPGEASSSTDGEGDGDDAAGAADGDAAGAADGDAAGAADGEQPGARDAIESPPLDAAGVQPVDEEADQPLAGGEDREPWLSDVPDDLRR